MNRIKYEGSQHQRRDVYSRGSRGGARGGCPLIFWPNWGPKGGKSFFLRPGPPPPLYLRVWMTGLPRYLKVWIPQRRGFVQGGIQGRGPGAVPPTFLPEWGQKGGKSFFFWDRVPLPPFISGSGWPGYPVIWRFGSATGVGVIKPLSKRSSWDVLVPKSVMFRVCKTKPLSTA